MFARAPSRSAAEPERRVGASAATVEGEDRKMSKQGALTLFLGVAIGANAVLLGLLAAPAALPTASGENATGTNGFLMSTGILQGKGNADALYILDTTNKKLAIYFMNNTRLELIGVRDMQFDLIPQSFSPKGGGQSPTVQEMREGTNAGG